MDLQYLKVTNKPIKNDALVEKMNRIFNFSQDYPNYQPVGSGDNKDFSSLRIDTGDNTLIVLMGNDDSPIPSFG